ncbi:MAG TPA: hypothetical protein VI072_01670 [Polyangiaceae bacterium]
MRKHAVLVPGFVGFDVLGQLKYYAGVTRCFRKWREQRRDVCVHFFDNFPTASVTLRAERLQRFIAKKVARGEIAVGDELTLIGHSTGGLDIRCALDALSRSRTGSTIADDREPIANEELLAAVRRVVFISVPQYGTNLADYLVRFRPAVQGIIHGLGAGLRINRSFASKLRRAFADRLPAPRAEVLLAINDALNESDETSSEGETQLADEREARAMLALWLDHMARDFDAIEDLTSRPNGDRASKSPAHFSAAERAREVSAWQGVQTRSYASRVRAHAVNGTALLGQLAAFAKPAALPARLVYGVLHQSLVARLVPGDMLARLTLDLGPALAAALAVHARPSLLFEASYALCADSAGPLCRPLDDASFAPHFQPLSGGAPIPSSEIAVSDNDGVVNTLSMLWPYDARDPGRHRAFLVEGDHADVIGHYRLQPDSPRAKSDRAYDAYDIFESGVGFNDDDFERLWKHIFEFAFST